MTRAPSDRVLPIMPGRERDPARVEHALGERIKELNCLYGIAQLAERHVSSIDALLDGVVRLLPPAWQYPETTCARLVFDGRVHVSEGFAVSDWGQSAPLVLAGAARGEVSVYYREERPASFEGPFLREERALINAVAEYVATLLRRIMAEQELLRTNRLLTLERRSLEEANTALRAVLARIHEEKQETNRNIHANVERVLLPILDALAAELPQAQRTYVELLRRQMADLTAPFVRQLTTRYERLTPAEIAVCNMIRHGLRTKEIARLRGVAPATVSRHREHIRRKLGITGRRLNLAANLLASGDGI